MLRDASFAVALAALTGALVHGTEMRERDERWVAPPSAAARSNPLAGRTDTVAGGRKLYQQRCATCHGDDGRGSSKAPDLTRAVALEQSDGALFWKISSGNAKAGMPSFSFLPELQRWQLVQSVRSLQSNPVGSSPPVVAALNRS